MLKQQLSQKLLQKLSPQQIQLMKLIQLPTQALEQKIKEELEENPALEEGLDEEDRYEEDTDTYEDDDNQSIEAEDINVDEYLSDDEIPDYRLKANNYSKDDEDARIPISGGISFTEVLMDQVSMRRMSEQDRQIAEYLIGNIDDDGYIRRELSAIVDDLAFTQNIFVEEEKLEEVLGIIQELDPPGVGARNLKECLLIQLKRKERTADVRLAYEILDKYFDEFTKKHYSKLIERLEIDEDYLKAAIEVISHLNPKPGNSSSSSQRSVQAVTPDFTISIEDGELELSLNSRNAPELNVSREYKDMLETYKASQGKNKAQKDAVMFVKQKLDSAKWFIDAIRQRQQTLLITMSSIMNFQKEYFLTGDQRKLRPMILKDIAEEIGMDISTVSRVASNKYVQTPYGTFLIKEFFSESMTNDAGEEVSTKEIKKILEDSISEENKRRPLTDEKLAKLLKEKGYPIARRTVAKYREQLGIPVARLRKEL
ncbi:MAG TPA: RNA polymerase sigma-54 factor [Cryomorphaceae bacterium]|nr:RNA polymerase sigma-54 factor [Owenweeksia sp.]MBF97662.1 RNA polymerase sigma-54 factor [Owenweeksia sp.]HAD97161.1 RNA polymerase sigma-54 factor [Cryomorphaceae bacterium]HBF20493.1 RNA polymerase sigma-54 factor [Cryomorphaceae bacterium]|tara:strand:- start:189 stop:1640 length:1452 start_codon:yes stop_codon:yes gene_type:complete